MDFLDDPPFVTDLFEFIVVVELAFAAEQVKAGADIIGIGDAAASLAMAAGVATKDSRTPRHETARRPRGRLNEHDSTFLRMKAPGMPAG